MSNLIERARCWNTYPADHVSAALLRHHALKRPPVQFTLQFKLHNPSRRKQRVLLASHEHVTRICGQVLREWQEEPDTAREDGIVATVLKIQSEYKSNHSRYLAEVLKHRFASRKLSEEDTRPVLTDYDIAPTILEGCFRECARMLLLWVNKLKETVSRMEDYKEQPLSWDILTQGWAKLQDVYTRAGATLIPFGRNRNTPLSAHGKREARWLLERLLSTAELERTLDCVNALLSGDPLQELSARFTDHPWKRTTKARRAVRESRMLQRIVDPFGEKVLLGTLRATELQALRNELLDLRESVERQRDLLIRLKSSLNETIQIAQSLTDLRNAIETFLSTKPPSYPSIEETSASEECKASLHGDYISSLRWFVLEEGDYADKFVSESREIRARDRLLKAATKLKPPSFQTIPFIRTMRPGAGRGFALLFDIVNQQYVLAVSLNRAIPPSHATETIAQPKVGDNLHYINFPATHFQSSTRIRYELFPLECGQDYQDRFLRDIIVRQLQEQQDLNQRQRVQSGIDISLEESLPSRVPLGFARIACHWNEHRQPEFFLQVVATLPAPDRKPTPTAIVGLHEHETGYSYAIIDADGTVRRVGDISIPRHVDPAYGAKPNTSNYAFETAKSILQIAQESGGLIAFEDTSYRKRRVSVVREENRRTFRRPSARIFDIVTYKANAAGLSLPIRVQGISPSRDCGDCGVRLPKGTKNLRQTTTVLCPSCGMCNSLLSNSRILVCPSCNAISQIDQREVIKDILFICPQCYSTPRLSRYNTAIAVARRAIDQLLRGRQPAHDEVESSEFE